MKKPTDAKAKRRSARLLAVADYCDRMVRYWRALDHTLSATEIRTWRQWAKACRDAAGELNAGKLSVKVRELRTRMEQP